MRGVLGLENATWRVVPGARGSPSGSLKVWRFLQDAAGSETLLEGMIATHSTDAAKTALAQSAAPRRRQS